MDTLTPPFVGQAKAPHFDESGRGTRQIRHPLAMDGLSFYLK